MNTFKEILNNLKIKWIAVNKRLQTKINEFSH